LRKESVKLSFDTLLFFEEIQLFEFKNWVK